MEEEQNRSSRFAYLLQPIKDLAKNWEIDIAKELEDYLEELSQITVTVGGGVGEKQIDFAEAALLIQGSTCVYSKKVEYLYQLVYNLLDLLTKKKGTERNKNQGKGGEGDAPEEGNTDNQDDEDFFSYDDVKESGNTDLKDVQKDDDESVGKRNLQPPMPMALIPFDDFEKTDVRLITRRGEVIGKKDDFKMNTCFIHRSGALLLDLTNGPLADKAVMSDETIFQEEVIAQPAEVHMEDSQPVGVVVPDVAPEQPEGSVCEESVGGDLSDVEMERAAPGPDATVLGGHPLEDAARGSVSLLQLGQRRGPSQRSAVVDLEAIMGKRVSAPRHTANSWDLLDPFQCSGTKEKRSKKGRPFKIPGTKRARARKRKLDDNAETDGGSETNRRPETWLCDFVNDQFYSNRKKFPKSRLKVPQWCAFEDLYWPEYKRRREMRRAQNSQRLCAGENEQEDERDDEGNKDGGEQIENRAAEEGPALDELSGGGLLEDDDFENPIPPPPEECVKDAENRLTQGSSQPSSTEPPSDLKYEELVQYYIDRYLRSAQQYASTTELSRRVQEWEDKILPFLKEEESRRPFDIHLYGSEILDKFSEIGEIRDFSEIVERKPRWEVCRFFLSSLMLGNTYNVEIGTGNVDKLSEQMGSMNLKLLSRERHHEQFCNSP